MLHTLSNDLQKRDKRWTKNFALRKAAQMPPRTHFILGRAFDIRESDAARWLAAQPEFLQLFLTSQKALVQIALNTTSGKWQGANHHAALTP